MQTKINDPVFEMAQRAILKIHPEYRSFLEGLMKRVLPIWTNTQSQKEVQIIHIVYFKPKEKLREILIDILELFEWQSEALFLFESTDFYRPSAYSQGLEFQKSYPKFPKVVVTDLLRDVFESLIWKRERCSEREQVLKFLNQKKELDFLDVNSKPSDAREALVINIFALDGVVDMERAESFLRFLWKHPSMNNGNFSKKYIPQSFEALLEEKVVLREELLFFCKDDFYELQLAFDLMSLRSMVEHRGFEILDIPVHLSVEALCYFQGYIAHKKLSYRNLKNAALDFFDPVFRQYPRFAMKLPKLTPHELLLDFEEGWRFKAEIEKP